MLCRMEGLRETLPGGILHMGDFLALIIGIAVAGIVFVLGRVFIGAGSAREKSLSVSAGADIMDEARRHSAGKILT